MVQAQVPRRRSAGWTSEEAFLAAARFWTAVLLHRFIERPNNPSVPRAARSPRARRQSIGAVQAERCRRTGFQPVSNAAESGRVFASSGVSVAHQTGWLPASVPGQAGSPSYLCPVQRRNSGDWIVPAKSLSEYPGARLCPPGQPQQASNSWRVREFAGCCGWSSTQPRSIFRPALSRNDAVGQASSLSRTRLDADHYSRLLPFPEGTKPCGSLEWLGTGWKPVLPWPSPASDFGRLHRSG
jgi:hypothetical protein